MEEKKSKLPGSLFNILILVVVVMNLLIGVYSLVVISNMNLAAGDQTQEEAEEEVDPTIIAVKDIEELLIEEKKIFNLAPDSVGVQYTLRMTVALGLNSTSKEYSDKKPVFESKKTIINDALDTIVRKYSHDDMKKANFMEELKEEVRTHLNEVFDTDVIIKVYLTDIYEQEM